MIEAFPNVFLFDGQSRPMPGVAFGKVMTVVREGNELTILNSAKLDDHGERQLRSLGAVKHLVRLGSAHGLDDGWFVEKFPGITTWAPPRVKTRAHGPADKTIDEDGALPIAGKTFLFNGAAHAEAALLLPVAGAGHGALLVTCDALQAHVDTKGASLLAAFAMRRMGFLAHPVIVGPLWLKQLGAENLRADFERVCRLEFKHMIAGHGVPVRDVAHEEVMRAVQRTFG